MTGCHSRPHRASTGMAVLAPLGRWQRAHWVTALGTDPPESLGTGQGPAGNGDCATRTPPRPAAAGLGQGPFSSGPGPGMPAWHWHWQGEGLMVSANLKRRATRGARVQLDAYHEPRAASSSDHIAVCRQATCYRVGSVVLNSAPAVTRPRVRMHRRRAQSKQNGARCVPHRCAVSPQIDRLISQPARYPTWWQWMRTS